MSKRTFVLFALALLVGACDFQSFFDALLPKEEVAFGKDYLARLRARDFEAVEAKLDPSIRNAEVRPALEKLAGLFPDQEPGDIAVVGSNVFTNLTTNVTTYNLTFQYEYPNRWVLANVVLERHGDSLAVKALHVQPLGDSLQHANRFTLQNKSAIHFAVLGLSILVPIFVLVSLIACIRTPIPKLKWLWIIFILLGFGQLGLNWTTGETSLRPIAFQLLGASVMWAGPYAPRIFSISIPVAAIVFWVRRRKWRPVTAAEKETSQGGVS